MTFQFGSGRSSSTCFTKCRQCTLYRKFVRAFSIRYVRSGFEGFCSDEDSAYSGKRDFNQTGLEAEQLPSMSRTSTDLHIDQLLRIIAEGTAAVTGDDFMRSLVRHLAVALDVKYAFVAEFTEAKTRVGTLAFWADGQFLENFEYDLPGTPCEAVLAGEMRLYKAGVQDLFPSHREELAAIGAESYLAIPLADRAGEVMGHLALIDVKPMSGDPSELSVFRIFAARGGAGAYAGGRTAQAQRGAAGFHPGLGHGRHRHHR
jgi:hypothetical protein